jgi:carbon storage regulator CsrA
VLVLARKLNESIVIGDNIRVTVVGLKNGVVKLGLDVPPEIRVMRSELIPGLRFDVAAQRQPLAQPKEEANPVK